MQRPWVTSAAYDAAITVMIEPWKLNAAWLKDNMQFAKADDREAVQARVKMLMRLSRDFRPGHLTAAGRSGLID